jgi:plastocyanin
MARRLAPVALASWLAVGLVACSGTDPVAGPQARAERTRGGDVVTVIAEDGRFPNDTYQATAGPVAISYRNGGSIGHTLVIEGVDGFKLDVAAKGDVDQATVELQPGEYTIYCDVAGHRQAGMEASLEVR